MKRTIALYVAALALASASVFVFASADDDTGFEPARFSSGDLVPPSALTIGGGEVLLQLDVDSTGSVARVDVLRSTPPFTEQLEAAVSQWRFAPAREVDAESRELVPVESKVLVAARFRPPTTYDAPARGEVPRDVSTPSPEVPYPRTWSAPPYPPRAAHHIGESMLLEAEVGNDGTVASTKVVRSAAGLDEAATDAVRRWTFRPAERNGRAIRSFVYAVIGFREPVISMR